jgi:flagellum-specific peptidoglycan hydrolase FlgJ
MASGKRNKVIPLGSAKFLEVRDTDTRDPLTVWWSRRKVQLQAYWGTPGLPDNRRFAEDGYTKSTSKRLWTIARKKAMSDLENIKKVAPPENEAAEEALLTALTVMRAPGDSRNKLAAAKLVLEFTKAKPQAKSEVTLKSAENWLASLAEDAGQA